MSLVYLHWEAFHSGMRAAVFSQAAICSPPRLCSEELSLSKATTVSVALAGVSPLPEISLSFNIKLKATQGY